MTREIKFRAKTKDGVWFYWKLSDPIDMGEMKEAIDWDTLGESTGLKDSKRTPEFPEGKEIYEGDILKIPDDYEAYSWMAGEVREIYYRDGCFRFKPKEDNKFDRGHHLDEDSAMEIIGNIYSNPELLK